MREKEAQFRADTKRKEAEAKEKERLVRDEAREAFPMPHLFTPRSYQTECEDAYQRGVKRFITVWPRGGGKDNYWLNFIAQRMKERVGTYYHVYPELTMGRRNLWDAYSNDGFRFLDHFPRELCIDNGKRGRNETEMSVEYWNGSRYQVMGADEPDRLRGGNPVGVAFSEYAWTAKSAWPILEPRVIKNGGWVSFNSTPDGHDEALWPLVQKKKNDPEWFYSLRPGPEIYQDGGLWRYDPETDNYQETPENGDPVYTAKQINELLANNGPDWVAQEVMCSFESARIGSFYGTWMLKARAEHRVSSEIALWDPRYGVSAVFDLGFTDNTSIWFFQRFGQNVNLIDYFEDAGHEFAYYAKVLRERPYRYNSYWAPHDVHQKHLSGGKSTFEVARDCGINFNLVSDVSFQAGIDAARMLLPRCLFNERACAIGIECLERYRKVWNRRLQQMESNPVHDRFSHGADAFRYLALVVDEDQGDRMKTYTSSEGEFDVFGS